MTLIECVAALALIGMAVLAAGAFVGVQPRLSKRLLAQQEAVRALEYALETVRAGELPLVPGIQVVAVPAPAEAARDLTVVLRTSPGELPGLFVVVAEASFSVQGRPYRRQITTMFWRPS